MDAPPDREDCTPFIRVAGYLEAMNLNAPRIIEANIEQGFLLLTDLGEMRYLDRLNQEPGAAPSLYGDALQALSLMQDRGAAYQSLLPAYNQELLRYELSLFHDWLCQTHLGLEFSDNDEARWQCLCDLLVANALDQPPVFVHRDYHSRNLMLTDANNPGILDFQDAVEGPLTYDLVSLLKDCYVRWEPLQVREWALGYFQDLDESLHRQLDKDLFMRYFDLMGVQRHLKASGIFARLKHRDDKAAYMKDVPRTLRYIVELGPHYEELGFLVEWLKTRCLPVLGDAS